MAWTPKLNQAGREPGRRLRQAEALRAQSARYVEDAQRDLDELDVLCDAVAEIETDRAQRLFKRRSAEDLPASHPDNQLTSPYEEPRPWPEWM